MKNKPLQSLKYFLNRYVLRKDYLISRDDRFGARFKFKTADDVGRKIYKTGRYEECITNYISKDISFNEGDVALDIGANIGWYSIVLSKVMPESAKIYSFEPDPLNYGLLSDNLLLNKTTNVFPIKKALSNKNEKKKLYQYADKNLGRHSLLEINNGNSVEVETIVIDQFLIENSIDLQRVKFAKIDIEGYEYFALLGADKVLQHIQCVVSEYIPSIMVKGGVEPSLFLELLRGYDFIPHVIKDGVLKFMSSEDLLATRGCDLIWLKG